LVEVFDNAIIPFFFSLSKKTFNQEMLPNLVEKTKQTYVFPILAECVFGGKLLHEPRV